MLYSLQGFKYGDLILAPAEREAWRRIMECGGLTPLSSAAKPFPGPVNLEPPFDAAGSVESAVKPAHSKEEALEACAEATRRATQTLEWATNARVDILSAALDHLTLARAGLYGAILSESVSVPETGSKLETETWNLETSRALSGLRQAGRNWPRRGS